MENTKPTMRDLLDAELRDLLERRRRCGRLKYLRKSDLVPALVRKFGYLVSVSTLFRWRAIHPLPLPCDRRDLFKWFDEIMEIKRNKSLCRRRAPQRLRKALRRFRRI